MGIQFPSWPLIFFTSFLSLVMFILVKTKNYKRLPPGPTKLPIIGNLHNILLSGDDHIPRVFRDLAKKHGPFMHLKLGQIPHIIVSSSDAAKEVLKTHDANFASRPDIFTSRIVMYNNTNIFLAPYGEYWRQMRKIVTLELLSAKKVKSFNRLRREEVCEMVDVLTKAATNGTPVNLSEIFLSLNNNVASRAGFGNNLRQKEAFLVSMKETVDLIIGFNISNYFPALENFIVWLTGLRKKAEKTYRTNDHMLNTVIDEHFEKSNNNKKNVGDGDEDFLDILLKIQKKNEFGFEFTMSNLKAVMLDMFIGGTETASSALEWAMSELVKNPETMKKVTSEVRQLFSITSTEADNYDNSFSNKMSYMQNVIKETFRLHPPLPLISPRQSQEKCQINNYDIDEKTNVLVNAWAIGRDPKKWENPEVFKPERFIGNSIDLKGSHFDLLPFGAGKRICPGITFGLANVELVLATILYHFNWKLPNDVPGKELDMTECVKGILSRKHPLILIPVFPTNI
ncbi:hypothetical protein ZOSMA_135G00040 [Zostera marina]|uniref:Cytochrome P450 n=1 Tax=Zostera marina TaxID=29655 RepID=A0A0K9Q0V5_ZOSMR|nr:hypothetical protein ZOSMA_135G00040 [Zostera marina]